MRFLKRKKINDDQLVGRHPLRESQQQARMGPNRTFSYYANRSPGETAVGRDPESVSERASPRDGKLRRFTRRFVILVVCLVVLASVMNELSLDSTPKVVALFTPASRVFLQSSDTYQRAATALLQSLSNRNKLTINAGSISSSMLHKFSELSAVSVALPVLGHRPTVYIQPSEPSMILVSSGSSSNFVLDTRGRALVRAGANTANLGKLHVPTVVDQNPLQIELGQTVLPTTTVRFIQTVATQLSAQHIRFTSMILPKGTSELDVYISGQPFYARFNTEDNTALQQTGTFIAVYKRLQSQGTVPHQYIDVRIDGRAYYK
jgi:hypothetical protein